MGPATTLEEHQITTTVQKKLNRAECNTKSTNKHCQEILNEESSFSPCAMPQVVLWLSALCLGQFSGHLLH